MPDMIEEGIARLITVAGVDMKTAQLNTLFTVPTGKTLYVFAVSITEPSASCSRR